MATTPRKRGDRWEICVRHKALLPKPIWLSYPTEQEAIDEGRRLTKQLEAGLVPDGLAEKSAPTTTIATAYELYQRKEPLSAADQSYWPVIMRRYGNSRLSQVNYQWVERLVAHCMDDLKVAPSTIRHHVGALSRLWDWLLKRGDVATNPFKSLRRGYASSGERKDKERDRRPTEDELTRLVSVLDGDLKRMVLLALETAMRMREMYTLTPDQVRVSQKTIFLDKTKNGDSRQVPMSSIALDLMKGIKGEIVFPKLWDGSLDANSLRATTSRNSRAFARACDKAGIVDLNFHDLRHEATCRLYERTKMSDIQIALVTGHKDLRMLKRYANLRGSFLADQMW